MKKFKLVTVVSVTAVLIGAGFFYGCKKEPDPEPDFNIIGNGGTAPCTIYFENTSKNATSYIWDFDGLITAETNPTKTYNTGGTYTVVLKAMNGYTSVSKTKQVQIQTSNYSQPPTANFTFSGSGGMVPCEVTFTNTSTNATSYSWDFGDGTTSTYTSVLKTYMKGGTFPVTLTARNAAGENQITKNVHIAASKTKVKITKVTITSMPFLDENSAGWDILDGPDVFIKIVTENNTVLYDGTSTRITNVAPASLPISWVLSTPFEITDFNAARFIDVWDYDVPDADDRIGYVHFPVNDYTSGSNAYPSTVTCTQNNITVKLDLIWQ